MINKQYKKIALGGTFDHFHKGHQTFIMEAGQLADSLLIGVTTPEMTQHKIYPELIESYETRSHAVKAFVKNLFLDTQVVPLNDQYGPTLEGSTVNAIIATQDTEKGAEAINERRAELQLPKLPIHICTLEKDTEGGVISSERIRSGDISRTGDVYSSVFDQDLTITDAQRAFFSEPQGNFTTVPSTATLTCVVGDHTLKAFMENNWQYDLGVYDGKIQRQTYTPQLQFAEDVMTVKNPAGIITKHLTEGIKKVLNAPFKHLAIEGEEDLAAVALVLFLPLYSHIYYGQPKQGMVEIVVTEKLKNQVFAILQH